MRRIATPLLLILTFIPGLAADPPPGLMSEGIYCHAGGHPGIRPGSRRRGRPAARDDADRGAAGGARRVHGPLGFSVSKKTFNLIDEAPRRLSVSPLRDFRSPPAQGAVVTYGSTETLRRPYTASPSCAVRQDTAPTSSITKGAFTAPRMTGTSPR